MRQTSSLAMNFTFPFVTAFSLYIEVDPCARPLSWHALHIQFLASILLLSLMQSLKWDEYNVSLE